MKIRISAWPVDKAQQQRLGFYDGFIDPGRLPEILNELYRSGHANNHCCWSSDDQDNPVFNIHFAQDMQK